MEIYIIDSGVRASHSEFRGEDGMTRVEDGLIFGNATPPVKLLIISRMIMKLINLY